jgi:hypothetical protein
MSFLTSCSPSSRDLVIFFAGPSLLTGDPIWVIGTGLDGSSRNVKTGKLVQFWILRRDVSPVDAAHSGKDEAICGNCKLREGPFQARTCYVNVNWAPLNVWRAAHAGRYPLAPAGACAGLVLRLGAYGDSAAAPVPLWLRVTGEARGWTGYTHQWADPRVQELRAVCMASVDSLEEMHRARIMGWRTFRVRRPGEGLSTARREVMCPAAPEAGHRTTCEKCRLCDGLARPKGPDVAIFAHGPSAAILDRQSRQVRLFG